MVKPTATSSWRKPNLTLIFPGVGPLPLLGLVSGLERNLLGLKPKATPTLHLSVRITFAYITSPLFPLSLPSHLVLIPKLGSHPEKQQAPLYATKCQAPILDRIILRASQSLKTFPSTSSSWASVPPTPAAATTFRRR